MAPESNFPWVGIQPLKSGRQARIAGAVVFLSQSENSAQPRRPVSRVFDVGTDIQQVHLVCIADSSFCRDLKRRANGLCNGTIAKRYATEGMLSIDVRSVVPDLRAGREIILDRSPISRDRKGRLTTRGGPTLVLLLLVAVDRIFQKVSEVVPQDHFAVNEVGTGAGFPVVAGHPEMTRYAQALRKITVAGIQRSPTTDQAGLNGSRDCGGGRGIDGLGDKAGSTPEPGVRSVELGLTLPTVRAFE
jgi:hypothetical protein